MRMFRIVIILIIILKYQFITSQSTFVKEVDSLKKSSYEKLSESFLKHKEDISLANSYAQAFILKAKQEHNILKKSDGYYMLSTISKAKNAILYCDSIIALFKDKSDYNYPAKAHILKAQFLGSKSMYRKSMDELAKANKLANINNNIEQQYQIKYFIALLNNNLGTYKKSLKLLKDLVTYYEYKYSQNAVTNYESSFTRDQTYESGLITALYAYGNQLNILKNFEEAERINARAIDLSLKSKDSLHYERLLFSTGVVLYHKKEYQSSIDSILKSRKLNAAKYSRVNPTITSDFYLGKLYFKQKKEVEAIKLLKRVDSFAFAQNRFFSGIQDIYEILIPYYKKQKNTEKQLFYINRLLKVDSVLDKNVKYLSREINNAYTIPNLILEKQKIIQSLKKDKITIMVLVGFLSISLIVLLIRYKQKQKLYRNRFKALFSNNLKKKTTNILIKKESKDLEISETIVTNILTQLQEFEDKNGFLETNISVASLSKKFKTNSKYFSKIVNKHKHKSFSNYINELRINYVTEELKENPKFRKFTIKAIASEAGFNSSEAFSKSFFKIIGMYPSSFIKQLEKQHS